MKKADFRLPYPAGFVRRKTMNPALTKGVKNESLQRSFNCHTDRPVCPDLPGKNDASEKTDAN